jgi:uncharacterized protein YukE
MDVEFSKVNKEKRLVSGWATLDNVDTQNDIVTADASLRAFQRARGNLREMHKKDSAVGRIVSFKEKEFRSPDGAKHNGIFVTAYVSRGAEDTWQKVLDKTLTGFSIGGAIIDSEEDFNKDAGTTVRVIKDYDLTELSLVDNPGNQYANVFHIQKQADGSVTVEGMAADTDITNVFYCGTDEIVQEDSDDSTECPVCAEKMVNIGWIEDGPNSDKKVNELVTKYLSPDAADAFSKGGVEVAKKNNEEAPETTDESVETGHEAGDPQEVPTPATPADEVEKTADVEEVAAEEEAPASVEEVHDEGEEISKKIDELKTVVSETLEKTRDETKEQVALLESKIDELQKSFDAKTSEFDDKFAKLDENLETAKSRLSNFEKSLNKINSSEAIRKSADLEEEAETVQETDTTWNGAFSVNNLFR